VATRNFLFINWISLLFIFWKWLAYYWYWYRNGKFWCVYTHSFNSIHYCRRLNLRVRIRNEKGWLPFWQKTKINQNSSLLPISVLYPIIRHNWISAARSFHFLLFFVLSRMRVIFKSKSICWWGQCKPCLSQPIVMSYNTLFAPHKSTGKVLYEIENEVWKANEIRTENYEGSTFVW
jgi:hypothetical protein